MSKQSGRAGHYVALDSLRGVAALIVVLHHLAAFYLSRFPSGPGTRAFDLIRSFGHPAVIVFFVLSGFVLMSSTTAKRTIDTKHFLVKRLFRIYPAFLLSMITAFLTAAIIDRPQIDNLGDYWNHANPILTISDFIGLLSLLLWFSGANALPVAWSLVHEMRFSLLFPLIVGPAWRYPRTAVTIVFLGITMALVWQLRNGPAHLFLGADLAESIMITAFYLPSFGVGMVLAIWVGNSTPPTMPTFLVAAAAPLMMHFDYDAITALTSSFIILTLIQENWLAKLFKINIMRFLGYISYSLYLVHFPILFYITLASGGQSKGVTLCLLIVGVVISVSIAWMMARVIEYPFSKAGKRVSKKFSRVPIEHS